MTSLVELSPLVGASNLSSVTDLHYNNNKNRHRHVLKSKQHTLKIKCNRALKRKLKKYKLRQDGQEDQDILDISDVLVTSLIIRSPNNCKETVTDLTDIELLRPKNYLCKMISKKQVNSTLIENKNCKVIEKEINENYCNSQERKQMNAFKLLMDSRNKIIGSNSPGKEKIIDETLVQDTVENKDVKAKRFLLLQKMAEEKGSLKKKEMEEYKEKCIKKKLEKRATKFKSMLSNQESKTSNVDKNNQKSDRGNEDIKNPTNQYLTKTIEKETKSLKLINIFAQSGKINDIGEVNKERMNKEDKEFLQKLSLPLKKKENMLCYFKKIEKESECSLSSENENKTIKVKLTSKSKKKVKRKKQRVQKEIDKGNEKNDVSKVSSDVDNLIPNNREQKKRKRNLESVAELCENGTKINKNTEIMDNRPKRNIKKPIKYSEELYQSSSDEELHIFTPKKKKPIDDSKISSKMSKIKAIIPQNTAILLNSAGLKNDLKQKPNPIKKSKQDIHSMKKLRHNSNITSKPVKLAPIFKTKQNSDLVAVEAKQKFLNSGIPDQLKKVTTQHKIKSNSMSYFTTVVHVQQKDTTFVNSLTRYDDLSTNYLDLEINSALCEENIFETLLNFTNCECNIIKKSCISKNVKDVLYYLKEIKPRYPIYRTYHMLRGKRKGEFKGYNYNDLDNSREVINGIMDTNIENPDQLSWSDRYKATSTNQIIGNFESINELKKWLVSWNENQMRKRNVNADSDSSDFYHSDSDSGDNLRNGNNLIILTGPVGSGKTSSVYAVASELAIKVLEVNPSNKRTGKIMLQDLQEATQSHKVNRGAGSSENSQKLIEIVEVEELKTVKKRGRPKKSPKKLNKVEPVVKIDSMLPVSQDKTRTDSSLILIDDADVVFEQDDGFVSAIVQLVQSSKRPVILVTATLSCQHLQRFMQNSKILRMSPLSPKLLGTWLDIMCLADTGLCFPGTGARFLSYFKGDIRKCINTLQFYMSTQSQSLNDEGDSQSLDIFNGDNENSNMSWINSEDSKDNNLAIKNIIPDSNSNYIWKHFMHNEYNLLHLKNPLQLFNIWWSLPLLISNTDRQTDNKSNTIIELQSIANAVDNISLSDYLNHSNKSPNVDDITSSPWSCPDIDNITEVEDLSCYFRYYETSDEICQELIQSSIKTAQKALGVENKYDIDSPGMAKQRDRDKIVSRHHELSKYLNQSAVLDRRALAVDYWSFCRSLCNVEKTKTNMQSKRKNRFCHYLKSVNILCKNDSFDRLSDSLCFNKK